MAEAVSVAIVPTLPMAAVRVAAMDFSATASFSCISASSFLLAASNSAACFSRILLAIDCARPRASANAFS